jgi:hypothetical protein
MAKKKKPSSLRPPAPKREGTFMRPEWRARIYGEGGRREPPPRTLEEAARRREETRKAAMPAWLRPFQILSPSMEKEAEAEARRRRAPGSYAEVMIPKSEREHIERMRQRMRTPTQAQPQAQPGYSGYSGYSKPGAPEEPRPRYGPPPPAARTYGPQPGRAPGSPLGVFDLPELWEGLRSVRSNPRFRGHYGVGEISREGRTQAERAIDTAEFFKIPEDVLRRYRPETLWVQWAEPFLKTVEDELNAAKPRDIPGRLKFDLARNGAFGLVYIE